MIKYARIKYGIIVGLLFYLIFYLIFLSKDVLISNKLLTPKYFLTEMFPWGLMLVWFVLMFYVGYELRKEYEMILYYYNSIFKEYSKNKIRRIAKYTLIKYYSQLLLPLFIVLPIAYLIINLDSPFTLINYIILGFFSICALGVKFINMFFNTKLDKIDNYSCHLLNKKRINLNNIYGLISLLFFLSAVGIYYSTLENKILFSAFLSIGSVLFLFIPIIKKH